MATVRNTFTSDSRDVEQALARMVRDQQKLREENRRLREESKRTGDAGKRSMDRTAGGARKATAAFTKGAAAAATMAAAVFKIGREMRSVETATAELQIRLDKSTRALRIQGGFNAAEGQDRAVRTALIAEQTAVPFELAQAAGRQLTSSGFADPAKSGTLGAFLAVLQSSNATDQDPVALAQASGQFLQAFGQKKTGANLLSLGKRVSNLFEGTDVQVGDLSEFAKAAPEFAAGGVSLEDTLSTLTILRETRAAGETATQARNVASILQTTAAKPASGRALNRLGLTSDDLDLVGETLPQALGRLKAGLDALPANQRSPVLTTLFGRENVGGARLLLENLDKYEKFAAIQRNDAGFQERVTTAQSGIAAARVRAENERIRLELERGSGRAAREETARILNENRLIEGINEASEQGGFLGNFKASFLSAGKLTVGAGVGSGFIDPSSYGNGGRAAELEGPRTDVKVLEGYLARQTELMERQQLGGQAAAAQNRHTE